MRIENKRQIHLSIVAVLLLVVGALSIMLLSSCSGDDNTDGGKRLSVCVASEPQTIDPALSSTSDAGTMILNFFAGLSKWEKDPQTGQCKIVPDLAESLPDPVKNADGTCDYTYKIKESYWSDGKRVTAQDFVFSWNRAASVDVAADYTYMFEVVDGYTDMWAEPPVEGAKLNVQAIDDSTIKVKTISYLPYWNELLAFPCYMPVREDVVDNEGIWATNPSTYICNGPFKMVDWVHNSIIRAEKNDTYCKSSNVKLSNLDFYLSDNSNNTLVNYLNGDWQFIKDIPTNETAAMKRDHSDEYHQDDSIGTYYMSWNITKDLSPEGKKLTYEEQCEVRKAIGLLIDRNYIVENIAQGGQTPASSFVPEGVEEPDGSSFHEHSGYSWDYCGYYPVDKDSIEKNYNDALQVLYKYYEHDAEGKITNFPTLEYFYNTLDAHKQIAEYFQNVLNSIGIKCTLSNQEWATFLSTKKEGNFKICRDSWIGDYTDATSFLDLFLSTSGNNNPQFGKKDDKDQRNYTLDLSNIPGYQDKSVTKGTWKQTYDKLISYVKTENNMYTRALLAHKAEDMIMDTGAVTPLYFYKTVYMLKTNVKGFYANALQSYYYQDCYFDNN